MKNKDALVLLAAGFVIIFIVAIPIKNLGLSLKLSFYYILFMYFPFIPFALKTKTSFIERFLIINLAGLSYAGIYVILDVVFRLPLTKILYLVTTFMIICYSWLFTLKQV